MNIFKSHFEMNSRFRNGIFILNLLLFLLIGICYLFFKNEKPVKSDFLRLAVYQQQIDSLKNVGLLKKQQYKLKPFNPNFITDYRGYVLGMSSGELDRLHEYRKGNKWINSTKDFKSVTGVSDSLLLAISPLFKFPEWVVDSKKRKKKHKQSKKIPYIQKKDINLVTSFELQEKIGVPDFIADRIITYREKIEGFISDIQLKDVKGLYVGQRNKILSYYTVKTSKETIKLNINKVSVKQLMTVPYFDFETAIQIRDYIEENNGISSFEELEKIEGFSVEKIDRIALYLKLN